MATISELKERIAQLKEMTDPDGLYQFVIDQKSFQLFEQAGVNPELVSDAQQVASNDALQQLPSKRPISAARSRHSLFAQNDPSSTKHDQPKPPPPSDGPKFR